MNEIRDKLKIPKKALDSLNNFILDENNPLINDLLQVIEKYGGIDEINNRAKEASNLDTIFHKLGKKNPDYVKNLEWLIEQRDMNSFISIPEYRNQILGSRMNDIKFDDSFAVTLELSSCQYFPFLIDIAKDAVENQKLIPGRIIRVRKMKEQEDDGDLLAMTAAMQIIGASYVETLDTKGTAPGPDGRG